MCCKWMRDRAALAGMQAALTVYLDAYRGSAARFHPCATNTQDSEVFLPASADCTVTPSAEVGRKTYES